MKLEYTAEIKHTDGGIFAPLPDTEEARKRADKMNGKKCFVTYETADSKSLAQNKAFHSLLGCFWRSGCSSFGSYNEMKDYYKLAVGHIAWTRYVFMTPDGLEYVTDHNDVPQGVKSYSDPYPASWANITVEKATQAINQLINDMLEAGVSGSDQSKKFDEIMDGLYNESWYE